MRRIIPLLILALALVGCSSTPTVKSEKSIRQVYSAQLAKLKIGMSTSEFQTTLPEAYVAGQNGKTTAYELKDDQSYILESDWGSRPLDKMFGVFPPQARQSNQLLWFYFYEDQLIKWGTPHDWPEQPDKIIEIRKR